jgi:hypothetical protein
MEINLIDLKYLLEVSGIEKRGVKPINVAKIMTALETEFSARPDGFAKHFGDASDQRELGGSGWKVIVGIERETFNYGFAKIGFTYNSEEEYEQVRNGKDEYKNKYFYCRVKTTYKNRTFYYRNHTLVDSVIKAYRDQQNNLGLALAE